MKMRQFRPQRISVIDISVAIEFIVCFYIFYDIHIIINGVPADLNSRKTPFYYTLRVYMIERNIQ